MERPEIRRLAKQILSKKFVEKDAIRNIVVNTCAALEGFPSTEQARKAADGVREGLPPEVAEFLRTLSYIAEYVFPALARAGTPEGAGESGQEAEALPAGSFSQEYFEDLACRLAGGAGIWDAEGVSHEGGNGCEQN